MIDFFVGLGKTLYFLIVAATIVLWAERTAGRDMSKVPDWLTLGMIVTVALGLSLIARNL